MEIKDFIKELEKLKEENDRLVDVKKRYVQIAQEIAEQKQVIVQAFSKIDNAINLLDPVRNYKPRQKQKSLKLVQQELFEKMSNGVQLTNKLVASSYPELSDKQVSYVLVCLSKMSGVRKEKDGGAVRLLMR